MEALQRRQQAALELQPDRRRQREHTLGRRRLGDRELFANHLHLQFSQLKTGNLGGKCADLNALFVGLVRAAGIPTRDIYGVRVASSKFGYKSLGANSEIITKAQHCRAEVFLTGYGWVATDPAYVRKVVLEEPPTNLAIDDPKVVAARNTLFGAWEGNWLAYNFAHDISLPGSTGPKIGFLMYPQGESGGARLDCLDADAFKYIITSKELTAA